MYEYLKLTFKKDEKTKEKYQDIMYEARKLYKGKLDSDIIIEALESKLRSLNCECEGDEK